MVMSPPAVFLFISVAQLCGFLCTCMTLVFCSVFLLGSRRVISRTGSLPFMMTCTFLSRTHPGTEPALLCSIRGAGVGAGTQSSGSPWFRCMSLHG